MAGPPYPSADMRARRRYIDKPTRITLSDATSATSAQLTPGTLYTVYATVEWYWRQGASDVTAASDCMLLEAYEKVNEVYISTSSVDSTADNYIAGLSASGAGVAYLMPCR